MSRSANIKSLWASLARANPEQRKTILDQCDEDTLMALRTMSNPYKKPVYKGNRNEILAFNVINLREKYYQRFSMTCLIGFIYRMLDEWEPPEAGRYVSINDPQFAIPLNAATSAARQELPIAHAREKATSGDREIALLASVDELRYEALFASQLRERLEKLVGNAQIEVGKATARVDTCKLQHQIAAKKLKLRTEFEGTKLPMIQQPEYNAAEWLERNLDKVGLSLFDKFHELSDMQRIFDNKAAELETAEADLRLNEIELDDLTSRVAANKARFDDAKFRCSELKKAYREEFKRKLKLAPLSDYELTDAEHDAIVQEVKITLGIETTREEFLESRQAVIQEFLDEWFLYNPDIHVQCAYKPNYDDKLRQPLAEAFREVSSNPNAQTRAAYKLAQEQYETAVKDRYELTTLPPDDSFFKLQRYIDNNYEELRQATDDIYCEKSDLEFDITPLRYFAGEATTIQEEADEWQRKYAEEFEGDVFQAKFGQHNLIASWQNNREKRDFYTKNSEIIKRIIKQSEDDQKMGRRLMKQRIDRKKKENVETAGIDSPGLANYRDTAGAALSAAGAKYAGDLNADTLRSANTIDESTKDEVELNFSVIKPAGRRRNRGITETGKFHIPSDKNMPEVPIMKPDEYQAELAKKNLKDML